MVNLPVVLVYGYGRGSCHFCNFEPLYQNAAFGFLKISNVRVGVAEYYLRIFAGMLVSRIGGGSGGWASIPLWCILLPARVVGFTRLRFGWDHKKYSLNMGYYYCTVELYGCLVSYNYFILMFIGR